jgi:predicted acyl esterase
VTARRSSSTTRVEPLPGSFSRRISKGSRLRLVISSPNTPGVEKNYNSGGVVADETAKDARTAHVTLYHDAAHPSALEIPVVP